MSMTKFFASSLLGVVSVLLIAAGCSSTSSSGQGSSAAGESCTRTYDCSANLICQSNVCVAPVAVPVGDGGSDASMIVVVQGPHLGALGESCQTAKDCASGLDCVPAGVGVSVCDVVNYNLMPTGKVCGGECNTATDCCELPLGLGLPPVYVIADGGFFSFPVTARTCQDLLALYLNGSTVGCLTAFPGSNQSRACFFYDTYCSQQGGTCGANTWACTNNRCLYNGACMPGAFSNDQGGCPSQSRAGYSLGTACDPVAHTCGGPTSGCKVDTDCAGNHVTDIPSSICNGGECVCYQGGCYIGCTNTENCAAGYSCDMTKKLCVQGTCTMNADCVAQVHNVRAQCITPTGMTPTCKIPCTLDHDCSPSGDFGTTGGTSVCSNGFCTPVGCTSDIDCTGSGVHTFCVPAPAASTSVNYESAITN
jgi:hypothetical protein